MAVILGLDAYSPREVADKVARIGVQKARLPAPVMLMLGMLGGAFIALGALYFNIVSSDPTLGYAATQVLGGIVFSTGLILVVVAGAELFTGNNLLVMAWADRLITTAELVRNWIIVYLANAAGVAIIVVVAWFAGVCDLNDHRVGIQVVRIAAAKTALPFWQAFFEGVICNILVCLAIWLAMAGRTVADKVLAIIFPISAFVAAGFEHSVANFYFIGMGLLAKAQVAEIAPLAVEHLDVGGLFANLLPVTLGNIVGGGFMVAFVYHMIYRRLPQNGPKG